MTAPAIVEHGTRLTAFRAVVYANQVRIQRHDGAKWRTIFRGSVDEWQACANAADDAIDLHRRAGGPTQ